MSRLLLLASAHTYRSESFLSAARKLGVEVVLGADVPPAHVASGAAWLGLDFREAARCVHRVSEYAREHPLQAILATDDVTVTLAAQLSAGLSLQHNSVESAGAARDKHQMRLRLAKAGLPSPWFQAYSLKHVPVDLARQVPYPCVIKPTCLSGSRGVMRANDPAEFRQAQGR